MKLDYVFIDLDGTLLEGKFKQYNCYKDILLKDGGNPLNLNDYWNMKRSKIRRDSILAASDYKGDYHNFYLQWIENIEKIKYLKFDTLMEDTPRVLTDWKNLSRKIVLVTMRNNRENLLWQLHELKLLDIFDEVINCKGLENPSKDRFIKHLKFDFAVVIGDTEEDTDLAKSINMKSIAITSGIRKKELLEADFYAEDISSIDLEGIINKKL